jgi:peptidylprolyl isomerase
LASNSKNRKRQQGSLHKPRTATAVRRQRQRERRRKLLTSGVAGAVVLVIVLALVGSGIFAKTAATTTTSSTSTPVKSAKGKPCVATKGPLPAGAPAVPVQVGTPPTKLVTKDLKVGTGKAATAASTVTVNYIGVACSTGVIFDSSYKNGSPFTTALSKVIPGWQQGIPGMKVGGQRLLGIPSQLAYGATGSPPTIAPDEALWFVVTLTKLA